MNKDKCPYCNRTGIKLEDCKSNVELKDKITKWKEKKILEIQAEKEAKVKSGRDEEGSEMSYKNSGFKGKFKMSGKNQLSSTMMRRYDHSGMEDHESDQ